MKKKDKQSDPQVEAEEIKASEETAGQKPDSDKASQPDDSSKELEDLKALLEEAQKDAAAKQELLLRTAAEYDNYRKRTQKEKEAAWTDAKALAVEALLPVLDNLERALTVEGSFEDLKKGIEMTLHQFEASLEKLGVEAIPAEQGDPFDPGLHNAVMHEEDDSVGENAIVQCFQKGYRMGDKVIRHSMVKVAN
ncbi:nucleotide exchange factor GrpE [[Clostridium] leptum]|uniref:Protein GrpE n=1 Tax=Solibaculum mannosilyticum TaxID=2780922 RepID=A0A7I8D474_9FIRM|nr:nucleotide exchange factor GrpE [Solibaculum mannosilyticum]MCO7136630.1 nucleotide exchange factor GrpE [[Clostridium] leptum]BCI59444.1 protein GrpE [Solibaculum mannosilyticum]